MKALLILLTTIFTILGLSAQDIIIKSNGDELECKILKVLSNSVQFKVKGSENDFEILRSEISEIIKGEEVRKELKRQAKDAEENRREAGKKKIEEEKRLLEISVLEQEKEEKKNNDIIENEEKEKALQKREKRREIAENGNGDVIITTAGEVLGVKIISVNKDEIIYRNLDKYSEDDAQDNQSISRSEVNEVIKKSSLATDVTALQKSDKKIRIKDISHLSQANRNKIKMSFTGLGNGSLIVGYERSLNLRLRTDILFKSHGTGFTASNVEKTGVGLELGVIYKLAAPMENQNLVDNSYLNGAYLKATVGASSINEQIENLNNNEIKFENINRDYFHLGLDLGYQWVLGTRLTLDIFMGLDYVKGSFEKTIDRDGELEISDAPQFGDGDLFRFQNSGRSAGIHIGYLFSIRK